MKKVFYLFAGVNGAGKSTLYNSESLNNDIKNTIRINTDEIVREIGDWKNNSDQLKAAKIAINLRNECFLYGKSFNEETTLTGKTILKTIERAKELGYELQLFYVGVSSTEIAKERIKSRVEKGGHHIENDIVEKRYYESLKNLKEILLKFDKVYLYDNSKKYKNIFSFSNNKILFKDNKSISWAKEAIEIIENNIKNK
ncbi:zeta toxin family protein [Fusobacterium pseudoperiodonticum]|uniref:zeta toxin family protein n=1 Tax=Fusobacterium pseudoperiodonticum TaxID=2663009 RepID=UPI000C1C62EF|nr:zeta toxin family protein [Fusobacterium pseudoperiodonticum]ATV64927.1 ATPase [Fusobacterium pseudoperiodonticum]ATV68112.1 ATPase [Fusobacterium pseudoperiodonticum]